MSIWWKRKPARAFSRCEAVLLQGHGVIVVEVVDAGDADARLEQRVGDMKADEAGGAGQEDVSGTVDFPSRCNPSRRPTEPCGDQSARTGPCAISACCAANSIL